MRLLCQCRVRRTWPFHAPGAAARHCERWRPPAEAPRRRFTAAINELKALIISAPVDLRDQLRGLTTAAQVAKCAAFRLPAAPLNELTAPNRPYAASRGGSRPSPPRPPTSKRASADSSKPSPPTCSTSPASDPSPPRKSTSPGHTPAAAATKQPSPASPASPHSKHPRGRTPATASTAAATANSTEHCTPSPSPAAATAPTPRPTSPNEPPKAKPPEKPNAASNATSPPDLPPPPTPQNQHLPNIEASFPRRLRNWDLWVVLGQRLAAVGPQSGGWLYVAPAVPGV